MLKFELGCYSSRNPRKGESSPVQAEELHGQEEARDKFQSRRFRLSQGFTYSRDPKISSTWKVSPSVHWTLPSTKESRKSGLLTSTTRRNVRHTLGVPCPTTKKVFECVRIDGPRGGVNCAFFKFLKQGKATLTYAILVRLNSPTG